MSTFYDYLKFDDERLKGIFYGWDGFGGNHGAVLKKCASLLKGRSVLDVGCGLCHLYELLKDDLDEYVGLDIDERVVGWARERYPELDIRVGDSNNLSEYGMYDTVYAIGLWRKIESIEGVKELLRHADKSMVLTYFHHATEEDAIPKPLWGLIRNESVASVEVIGSKILGTDILRINKKHNNLILVGH